MHPGRFVSTLAAGAICAAALACAPAAALASTVTAAATTTTTTSTTSSAQPPSATTGAASGVSYATATLAGTVNPNGTATSYYFQYGPSTTYGTQTATQSAGAGTSSVAASSAISGLQPATTYHFRVVATSGAGPTNGNDQTFTTPATPAPGVATGGAKDVTSNAAVVTGQVNPNGVPTTYEFQYGKTPSYGLHTAAVSADSGTSTLTVGGVIGGLSATTTYHYRLIASSGGGTVTGSDHTFKTGAAPKAGVATGSATQISSTGAVLNGLVRPNGSAATYYFQIGKTSAYTAHTAVTSAGAGTATVPVQVPIGGLTPLTKYHYRLVVSGLGGTIAGSDHTFTTTSVPLVLAATITPDPTAFGGSATVTGVLSGTAAAGRQVVLQGTSFPYVAPFATLGNAEVVAANGTFSFPITGLLQNTEFRVVTVGTPTVSSPVLTEGVTVHVTFGGSVRRTSRGLRVRVSGSIAPADTAVIVSLQKLVRGRWTLSARLTPRIASPTLMRFSRTLRLAHGGRYRVLVRVTDGARRSVVSRSLLFRRPPR